MSRSRTNSVNSVSSNASLRKMLDLNKIEVYIEYACFICGIVLSSPKTCLDHVRKIHGYELPPRPVEEKKRPRHHRFKYVRDKSGPYTIVEYACPSCWFHSPETDLEALNEHIREEHPLTKLKNGVRRKSVSFKEEADDNNMPAFKKEEDHTETPDKKPGVEPSVVNEAVKKLEELIVAFRNILQPMSNDTKE